MLYSCPRNNDLASRKNEMRDRGNPARLVSEASTCILAAFLLTLAACGGGGASDGGAPSTPGGNGTPEPPPPAPELTIFATGLAVGIEFQPALDERYFNPLSLTADAENLYVADAVRHVILRIAGDGRTSVLAGQAGKQGHADGPGAAALFNGPEGMVVERDGSLLVADKYNAVIRRVAQNGTVSTIAGGVGEATFNDGPLASARFYNPVDLALAGDGTLYVAEPVARLIRAISPDGHVTTRQNGGLEPAPFRFGELNRTGQFPTYDSGGPTALAIGPTGDLYVTDAEDKTVRVLRGNSLPEYFAGQRPSPRVGLGGYGGDDDGVGSEAAFASPRGLAFDSAGNLYVADMDYCTIRRIRSDARVETIAGLSGECDVVEGAMDRARPGPVADLVVQGTTLFASVPAQHMVIKISHIDRVPAIDRSEGRPAAATASLSLVKLASGLGMPQVSGFQSIHRWPVHMALDATGTLYFSDGNAHTINRFNSDGSIAVVAGAQDQAGFADGAGPEARFDGPEGMVFGIDGSLFVIDKFNRRVRQIRTDGSVATVAGGASGSYDNTVFEPPPKSADGNGMAAKFLLPQDIAIDPLGNLWVADPSISAVRKVSPSGDVTTIAGGAGCGFADGPGSQARFSCPGIYFEEPPYSTGPHSIVSDSSGNIFVSDPYNQVIRRITPDGTVTTFAGKAKILGSADGTGNSARFRYPLGIAIDARDNLYVSDVGNGKIRRIDPSGRVTTLFGARYDASEREGVLSAAQLASTDTLAFANGTLFISASPTVSVGNSEKTAHDIFRIDGLQ